MCSRVRVGAMRGTHPSSPALLLVRVLPLAESEHIRMRCGALLCFPNIQLHMFAISLERLPIVT